MLGVSGTSSNATPSSMSLLPRKRLSCVAQYYRGKRGGGKRKKRKRRIRKGRRKIKNQRCNSSKLNLTLFHQGFKLSRYRWQEMEMSIVLVILMDAFCCPQGVSDAFQNQAINCPVRPLQAAPRRKSAVQAGLFSLAVRGLAQEHNRSETRAVLASTCQLLPSESDCLVARTISSQLITIFRVMRTLNALN